MHPFIKVLVAGFIALVPFSSGAQFSPDNDLFANRTVLTGTNMTVLASNENAGAEPGEYTGGPGSALLYHSVWYTWTAPTNGVAYLTGEGLAQNFFLGARIYLGSAVDALTLAAYLPDGGVLVAAGDQLSIQFTSQYYPTGGFGGGSGPFRFNLWFETPSAPSPNDSFANRLDITSPTYHFDGTIFGATSESGEPLASQTSTQTLWFNFNAPATGQLTTKLSAPGFNLEVRLYEGNQLADLKPVPPLTGSPLAYSVAAKHQYALQISGGFTLIGNFALDASFLSLANDNFTNSLQLQGDHFTVSGDNRLATLETGEILPQPESAGRTLWYSWAAPFAGRVTIASGSPYIYCALAVYSGWDLDQLQPVAAGLVGFPFQCEKDIVYHIQLDGAADRGGEFTLSLNAAAFQPPTNDAFDHATLLVGDADYAAGFIADATLEPGEPAHLNDVAGKSLWWDWQATRTGDASIGDNGSLASNLLFAVYTGPSVEALTLVGKQKTSLYFSVIGGTTYHIAVVAEAPMRGDASFVIGSINISTNPVIVPGNILREPSFEGTGLGLAYWYLSSPNFGGGYVGERGGADGNTWIVLAEEISMWQDFATVPGRRYEVRFACRPEFGLSSGHARVRWDDRELGIVEAPGRYWFWPHFITTASNTTSRLTIEIIDGRLGLDGFSVVPDSATPIIITQPLSASTFAGAAASFVVDAIGSAPLTYQWYFNGVPLSNETAHELSLDPVSASQAGQYFAVVTNVFGAVTSSPATLVVEAPTSPTIVLQPYSDVVSLGGYFAFSTAAVGTPTLHYQWFFNDEELSGATNRQMVLSSVRRTDAGTYSVKVWNAGETVYSIPATLTVDTNIAVGGAFWLANEIPNGGLTYSAPVFDTDGITRLSGSNFVAQLYAGLSIDRIRAFGQPRPFRVGFSAGLIDPASVELPNFSPFVPAFVQVRVWQANKGASYEEARALGNKFGKSDVLQIFPGAMRFASFLWGLQSFALKVGLPQFNAGIVTLAQVQKDGTIVGSLRGQAGSLYVIEKKGGVQDFVWRPFIVITNITGTVNFTDQVGASNTAFYRARILD